MTLRILTLGGLTLEVDGQVVTGALTQRRRLAVLLLLGQAGARGVARERLLAMFWPERDDAAAGHGLAQLLYSARRELGGPALVLGTKTLRLNPEMMTTDAAGFEAALDAGDPAGALGMYHGAFADGFHVTGAPGFADWLEAERARLAGRALGAAMGLGHAAHARAAWVEATGWFQRAVAIDPWAAPAALALAESRAGAGDLAGAVRALEQHGERLRRDLDLPPDPAVVGQLARWRSGARPGG